jgi:hypothetical protein
MLEFPPLCMNGLPAWAAGARLIYVAADNSVLSDAIAERRKAAFVFSLDGVRCESKATAQGRRSDRAIDDDFESRRSIGVASACQGASQTAARLPFVGTSKSKYTEKTVG